ncbi:hypothetical protein SteCoe_23152 [Stentor coeruleus]|uniref:Uncharacterized protein n=1 Tax=Stentor coeruleus TaxID=5963 RepID=A0A1R2BKK0_9CILI|nr:hypothetical protein SteCoe_23152 [Stentor coeruleus]
MKDKKPRSLEWLKNLNASEIIEVDLEADLPHPSSLVPSTLKSQNDFTFQNQLNKLYSKIPISQPKPQNSKDILNLSSLETLPQWTSLCKEVTITSPESFEWLKNINSELEINSMIEASQGIISPLPCRAIYSSISYWGCENISETDWMPTIRNIYYMFVNKKCNYFHVIFRRFYIFFTWESQKPVVYVANPTSQLIANLKKFSVDIPQEELENDNFKVKEKKKNTILRIDRKSVQAFYNYLINSYGENKIVSPCVFLNGAFRNLNVTFNCEAYNPFEKIQKQYKLGFAGSVTFDMIKRMCMVLEKTQNTFVVELVAEMGSSNLPGVIPVKIVRKSLSMYDIIN